MPRLTKELYVAQNQIVLELASRPGGVCRNEIMRATGCSRPRAEVLVEELKLSALEKYGRVQFFGPPTDPSVIEIVPCENKVVKDDAEIALLESKVRKLSADLEIARAKLITATLKAQLQEAVQPQVS